MEPVEGAGCQEGRENLGTAFDQQPLEAALCQRRHDISRMDMALVHRQEDRRCASGHLPLPALQEKTGTPSSASTRAFGGRRALGSITTRAG